METGRKRCRWSAAVPLPLRHLALVGAALALLTAMGAPREAAASEARTLSFFHTHTKETATVTFWRDGGSWIDVHRRNRPRP